MALGLLAFAGYQAGWERFRSDSIDEARAEEAQQITELTEILDHALAAKAYVASDAYIEREARTRLGWVRAGEVPIVVDSPPPVEPPPAGKRWWQRLYPR